MRNLRTMLPLLLPTIVAPAAAQTPATEAPAQASEAPAQASGAIAPLPASGEAIGEADATLGNASVTAEQRTGFTTGLRLGVGVPLGKAGRDAVLGLERDLNDLTPWRVPVWVDVGYSLTGAITLGAYGQVGTGKSGDSCDASSTGLQATADCDWSDIRVGAEVEWRLAPGAPVDPWLGIGLGYEWLSYRVLLTTQLDDGAGGTAAVRVRATERLGGPELMLHGGIDFQVDDSLRIGPYASATLSQYLTDSFRCQPPTDLCAPDDSIEGAAFHSWIGLGLRGAYTP